MEIERLYDLMLSIMLGTNFRVLKKFQCKKKHVFTVAVCPRQYLKHKWKCKPIEAKLCALQEPFQTCCIVEPMNQDKGNMLEVKFGGTSILVKKNEVGQRKTATHAVVCSKAYKSKIGQQKI